MPTARARTRPARTRSTPSVTIVEGGGAHSPEWFAGTAVVVIACAVVLLLDLADVRFVVGVVLIVGALALERLRRTLAERARGDDTRPAPRPPLH